MSNRHANVVLVLVVVLVRAHAFEDELEEADDYEDDRRPFDPSPACTKIRRF